MARVLVNMPSQHGGLASGVARVAFALLEHLLADGRHRYVLRSNWTRASLPAALGDPALEVVTVPRPANMLADVLRQTAVMPRWCRARGIDVVWNLDPYGAARGGRARVTTLHDCYFRSVAAEFGRRAAATMALCHRLVLGGSTRIVAVSRHTRGEARALYPALAGRVEVIGHASTLPPPAACPPREIGERYLLLVGKATPNKNFALVGAALTALPAAARPRLVHVGHDPDGSVPADIRLPGIADDRLAALYAHAEALVVPSLAEGFCLPVVEAQAAGCPVIAARAAALPEVAGAGALFFDPRDPAALAARLVELHHSRALRDTLIERGRAEQTRHSWPRAAARYADLFADLAPGT